MPRCRICPACGSIPIAIWLRLGKGDCSFLIWIFEKNFSLWLEFYFSISTGATCFDTLWLPILCLAFYSETYFLISKGACWGLIGIGSIFLIDFVDFVDFPYGNFCWIILSILGQRIVLSKLTLPSSELCIYWNTGLLSSSTADCLYFGVTAKQVRTTSLNLLE